MSRSTTKNLRAASRFPFAKRFGFLQEIGATAPAQNPLNSNVDHDYDNDSALTWSDVADVNSLRAVKVDVDNRLQLNDEVKAGASGSQSFPLQANGLQATQAFFIADRLTIVTGAALSFATAGTNGSAVTAQITHETGVQAPGTGTPIQSNTFNMKGTINTPQVATLLSPNGDGSPNNVLILSPGDRLSIAYTGTTTTLAGVIVNVNTVPGLKEEIASYYGLTNGVLATAPFFVANRDMVVTNVNIVWATAGSVSATINVTHETTTGTPGSGTSILTGGTALSAITTANTVASPALNTGPIVLLAGDRLSVLFAGTLTTLAGVLIQVTMQQSAPYTNATANPGYYGQIEVPFNLNANGSLVANTAVFLADRDYEVVDASACWATANAGGTFTFTIDKGTTAPGSGTVIGTAVATTTSANTPAVLVLNVSRRAKLLSQGDRLTLQLATIGALAGLTATVSLMPR